MTTVTAYAATSATEPLTKTTITRREVGPNDVRFDIHFAGICHSDIHTVRAEWGQPNYPVVPGHEIAGIDNSRPRSPISPPAMREVAQARGALGLHLAIELQRQVAAIGSHQADRHRHMERILFARARRGRAGLRQRELVAAAGRVVAHAHGHARRACLRVPAAKARQVATSGRRHCGDEVIAGHGMAVVPLEVKRQAAPEGA
jgi:hypothetical protein